MAGIVVKAARPHAALSAGPTGPGEAAAAALAFGWQRVGQGPDDRSQGARGRAMRR